MKIVLRWPQCNDGYEGAAPRPLILDTNVVLDMLIFDDPHIPPIRELVADGQLRWIADRAQRIELERVLQYSQIAPRVAFYGKTVEGVLAAFDAAVEYVPEAQKIRFTCTDPDDQHFLDLASAHQALLVSKDKAVLKLRKRVAQYYGATVGNIVEYAKVAKAEAVEEAALAD
ncbi:putative toxin-antitoxin system toxin component, PIN family [Diaphorobacter sp. HDW4A]|uniref:putative toxin-antitoxin system toxin component, PIN family n=1 Tax=Diaphorobacter sp. HDW4A TaxID=2714924 RepID=UPI00140CAAC0|nr:putative toxin-antitoxin system toxin component, PIN family [Diaphorobacter sp. HDW4A]QIL82121.1 putative toxin-antitoxin system toxin component, PIN family [Diaphorobacter sp. HDW4A]